MEINIEIGEACLHLRYESGDKDIKMAEGLRIYRTQYIASCILARPILDRRCLARPGITSWQKSFSKLPPPSLSRL